MLYSRMYYTNQHYTIHSFDAVKVVQEEVTILYFTSFCGFWIENIVAYFSHTEIGSILYLLMHNWNR